MKKITLMLILSTLISQASHAAYIEFLGCWQLKLPAGYITEKWVRISGKQFVGRYERYQGSELIEAQDYRIDEIDSEEPLLLTVYNQNQKIGEFEKHGDRFKNKNQNDFPKSIEYKILNNPEVDGLRIFIEGFEPGESIRYDLKSIACNGLKDLK